MNKYITNNQLTLGMKFGRWTVLAIFSRGKKRTCYCRCECGTERDVDALQLRKGRSLSCGCGRASRLRHGYTRKGRIRAEWQAWNHMLQRCYNPKDKHYKDYGVRGIRVCERWRNSFDAFIADMGDKPSSKHSLDRIDNDADYGPGNCRWATLEEQARNKRSTRMVVFNGKSVSTSTIAEQFGIKSGTLKARLDKGWSLERSLHTEIGGG